MRFASASTTKPTSSARGRRAGRSPTARASRAPMQRSSRPRSRRLPATSSFRSAYVAAFLAHLAERDERTLYAAWELGRDAMVSGVGVMDLAEAHHEALLAGLRSETDVFATTRAA